MEDLKRLAEKRKLSSSDASSLLRLLQEQATAILSLRGAGSLPVTSLGQPALEVSRWQRGGMAASDRGRGRERRGGSWEAREVHRARQRQANEQDLTPSEFKKTVFSPELHRAVGASARSPNIRIDSLEEFPPVQNSLKESSRKGGKKSCKPRRITLTAIQLSPHTEAWSSNPAFAAEAATVDTSSTLSEERRLLRQERSRRGGSRNRTRLASKTKRELQAVECPSLSVVSESTGSGETQVLNFSSGKRVGDGRRGMRNELGASNELPEGSCQQSQFQQAGHMGSDSQLGTSIKDSTISDLKKTQKGFLQAHMLRQFVPSSVKGPLFSKGGTIFESKGLLGSLSGSTGCDSATLVSTTDPSLNGHAEVSIGSVSNRQSLDAAAELYSALIIDRLVPNLTAEIHFLVQLLTVTGPTGPPDHLHVPGSEQLFGTVDNCVYFAVTVFTKARSLLTPLDKATLQLLSENTRVRSMQPELSEFCRKALEKASAEGSTDPTPILQSVFDRVPFQEETDNIKNFPNMRVFHAFKKQRDLFYSILREWEMHHEEPGWQYAAALGKKIRQLLDQPSELRSLDHLARLFQKQLLESCGHAAHIALGVRDLQGHLKHMNPNKLIRLNERFMRQSSASDPSMPPRFSHAEEFFSEFIALADSYSLNHHLSAIMLHELMKLHARCVSVAPREVAEVLQAMRVLAKFLGFIEFLPYSNSSSSLAVRNTVAHPSIIMQCVQEARDGVHLCLTIPWVVEYLSMMDSQAPQLPHYHHLLCQLIDLYRALAINSLEISVDHFLVLAGLGWLFEIPNISSSFFFEYLRENASEPAPTVLSADNRPSLVSRELLYICCPFLAGIRSVLAEFAAGLHSRTSPIRKIRPISTDINKPQMSLTSQTQMKLQDSFFRSHPPFLKHMCDIVSERVGEAATTAVQRKIVPNQTQSGVQMLATWVAEKWLSQDTGESSVEMESLFLKSDATRMVASVSDQVYATALKEAMVFCREHCQTNITKALNVLLCDIASDQVTAVAVGIACNRALDRCVKWIQEKLKGIIYEEVSSGFGGLKKAFKAGRKDASQLHNVAASPVVSSTANTTEQLNQTSLGAEHSSISLSSGHLGQPAEVSLLPPVGQGGSAVASTMEKPEAATDPITHFMKTAVMVKESDSVSADQLRSMGWSFVDLKSHIATRASFMPGIKSPQLLPSGIDDLLRMSIEVAVHLASYGLLGSCVSQGKEPILLVKEIVSFWVLLKNLKWKIPIYTLLNEESVLCYLQQVAKGVDVWSSLGSLLLESILCDAVQADIVEAMWLCRMKRLQLKQRQEFVKAAAVFLDLWYSHHADHTAQQGCPAPSQVYVLKDVYFVRLLVAIVQESESNCSLPQSLQNHPSLPYLSPFLSL